VATSSRNVGHRGLLPSKVWEGIYLPIGYGQQGERQCI
jgi:hypothetical protein